MYKVQLDGYVHVRSYGTVRQGPAVAAQTRRSSHPWRANNSGTLCLSVVHTSHSRVVLPVQRMVVHVCNTYVMLISGYCRLLDLTLLFSLESWILSKGFLRTHHFECVTCSVSFASTTTKNDYAEGGCDGKSSLVWMQVCW